MALSEQELAAQTNLTIWFRDADVELIVLSREVRTLNAAGGWTRDEAVLLSAQLFRLLPQEDGATARVNAEGESATPEFVLLGAPDCDMARWDTFSIGARRFQIVYVDERQYERKGEAVFLGY